MLPKSESLTEKGKIRDAIATHKVVRNMRGDSNSRKENRPAAYSKNSRAGDFVNYFNYLL